MFRKVNNNKILGFPERKKKQSEKIASFFMCVINKLYPIFPENYKKLHAAYN